MSGAADQLSNHMENGVLQPKTNTTAALDAAVDFTGGTLGGVATVLIGQPLDTIKVSRPYYFSLRWCLFTVPGLKDYVGLLKSTTHLIVFSMTFVPSVYF